MTFNITNSHKFWNIAENNNFIILNLSSQLHKSHEHVNQFLPFCIFCRNFFCPIFRCFVMTWYSHSAAYFFLSDCWSTLNTLGKLRHQFRRILLFSINNMSIIQSKINVFTFFSKGNKFEVASIKILKSYEF